MAIQFMVLATLCASDMSSIGEDAPLVDSISVRCVTPDGRDVRAALTPSPDSTIDTHCHPLNSRVLQSHAFLSSTSPSIIAAGALFISLRRFKPDLGLSFDSFALRISYPSKCPPLSQVVLSLLKLRCETNYSSFSFLGKQ
jgi:hypothetical protein